MVGASKYFKEKREEILPIEVLLKFCLYSVESLTTIKVSIDSPITHFTVLLFLRSVRNKKRTEISLAGGILGNY